jgi:hypothetical protein
MATIGTANTEDLLVTLTKGMRKHDSIAAAFREAGQRYGPGWSQVKSVSREDFNTFELFSKCADERRQFQARANISHIRR